MDTRTSSEGRTALPALVCAWCGAVIRSGDAGVPPSHGMCTPCAESSGVFQIEPLERLSQEAIDALPFGLIRLAPDGTVTAYNDAESAASGLTRAEVVGRNFFRDVAPCTRVATFEGAWTALRAAGADGRRELAFIVRFRSGPVLCRVVITHDAATGSGTVLIRRNAD